MARPRIVSDEFLDDMREVEKRGREWAYYRERPVSEELDRDVLSPMSRLLTDILVDYLKGESEAGVVLGDIERKKFFDFVYALDTAVSIARADLEGYDFTELSRCREKGVSLGDCTGEFRDIVETLKRVDKASEKLFGSRCTWLLGVKEPYTASALINDLTACFHRVIDFLSKHQLETEGKCSWVKGADEKWVELCKEWDAMTERLNELELYNPGDYEALEGVVLKDRAEFRVGSAEGHKVHIDFSKRKRVLEYYDKDEEVNGIIRYLLECFAVEGCEYMNEDGIEIGVRCWWDKEWDNSALPKIAEILAFATSMDFRISDTLYYWPKALTEYVKDDVDRMEDVMRVIIDTCDDIEEREKRLIELMISES